MEGKSKGAAIFFVVGLALICGVVTVYIYYISLGNVDIGDIEFGNSINDGYNDNLGESDYVSLENANYDEDKNIQVKKVVFNNLPGNLVANFEAMQNTFFSEVNDYSKGSNFKGARSDISYTIKNNILSVFYNGINMVGEEECNNSFAINIDLENASIISDEDVLELVNYNYEEIAKDYYNSTVSFMEEEAALNGEYHFIDLSGEEVTLETFKEEQDKYIELISSGLSEKIDVYIDNNLVKYGYYENDIASLYSQVAKESCESYITYTVGMIR